ncbi:MAG: hypothetical protein M5U12_28230 [Verrucomicrobia bacterium]|nr:hypothetical protein [Verrucomicrobiota bacterium]
MGRQRRRRVVPLVVVGGEDAARPDGAEQVTLTRGDLAFVDAKVQLGHALGQRLELVQGDFVLEDDIPAGDNHIRAVDRAGDQPRFQTPEQEGFGQIQQRRQFPCQQVALGRHQGRIRAHRLHRHAGRQQHPPRIRNPPAWPEARA